MYVLLNLNFLRFSTFDYDYGDIYDDAYYAGDYYGDGYQDGGGNDDGQTAGGTTEEESVATEASETTENANEENSGRRKRSTGAGQTSSINQNANTPKVRKTNSASSVLGLNLLLYQKESDYNKPPNWEGIVQNSYLGFKVR